METTSKSLSFETRTDAPTFHEEARRCLAIDKRYDANILAFALAHETNNYSWGLSIYY